MRRLILIALLMASLPAWAQGKPPLLVLVTSPAPMTQAMAMLLSHEALTGYAGPALQPTGLTAQQMLRGVIQAGVQVQICPIFLANSADAAAALIEGVAPTTPAHVEAFMDRPDVRFLNF